MHLKRIIDGKVYNTETAELVCDATPDRVIGMSRGDFGWEDTKLYRSPKGQFFLAGQGGALTRWARAIANGSTGGDGIQLLSVVEARAIAERAKLCPTAYERLFGAAVEG